MNERIQTDRQTDRKAVRQNVRNKKIKREKEKKKTFVCRDITGRDRGLVLAVF